MANDGSLVFDTKVDQRGFATGMATLKSTAMSAISAIGAAFASGAIVSAMVTVGKKAVELASNLNEVQNVVDVTFGASAEKANEFAKSAKTSFGLSELAAKQYLGTMGAMLKSMGLSTDAALDMSMGITGLAADFSSFYNITSEDAFMKIRAGLAGEVEPLRQLGINMSIANLDAFALAQGMDKVYASMTQDEQALLRYNYLMSVSSAAQGDFARTSEGYANTQRVTALSIDEVYTAIGTRLLPMITKATREIGTLAGELAVAIDERGISGAIDVITDRFPVATAAVAGLASAFAALLIIDILTPSVKALAVAQKILNAAINASPVLLLASAIGILVGAVTLLNKQYERLHPDAQQAIEDVDALSNEVNSSSESFKTSGKEIESQQRSMDALVDTLQEMSDGYSGTGIEQRKMQSIVDELNGNVSGLSLSFDAQTGKLSMNADAIREVTKAQYDAAKSSATLSRYTKLLEEQADAEYTVRIARAAFYAAGEGSGATTFERLKLNKALREATGIYSDVTAEIDDCNAQLKEQGVVSEDTAEKTDELAKSTDDLAEAEVRVVLAGVDVTDLLESIGMTADEAATRLDTFTGAATNMFGKISTKSKDTAKTMTADLKWNAEAMEQFGEDIVFLYGKLPKEMVDAFSEDPEGMAGAVRNLAKSSDSELEDLADAFSKAGEKARTAWLQSLNATAPKATTQTPAGGGIQQQFRAADEQASIVSDAAQAITEDESLNQAVVDSITSAKTSMETAVVDSDFAGVSASIVDTIIENLNGASQKFYSSGRGWTMNVIIGMLSRKSELESDARSLALAANSAFNSALRMGLGSETSSGLTKSGSGVGVGVDGGGSALGTLPQGAKIIPFSSRDSVINPAKLTSVGGTTTINAPITVQGVVESDAKLSRRITKEFQGVILNGRE